MTPPPTDERPLWLVCEDGHEYIDRFTRFLPRLRYRRAGNCAEAVAALHEVQVAGLLLDLDFRRCPPAALVDQDGKQRPDRPAAESRRLSAHQGVHILRHLRRTGAKAPAILCADFDDPEQAQFLEHTLAPLRIAPSNTGMDAFARWMGTAGRG